MTDEADPLATINAALHEQDNTEESQPWLPLESNPVSSTLDYIAIVLAFAW